MGRFLFWANVGSAILNVVALMLWNGDLGNATLVVMNSSMAALLYAAR